MKFPSSRSIGRSKPNAVAALAGAAFFASALAAPSQSFTFNTLAGNAGQGSTDGNGTNARFHQPLGVVLDNAGTIYVSDSGNHTIRKITTGGVVTTLAGKAGQSGSLDGSGTNALFFQPAGLAVDGAGNIYVADSGNSTIRKITASGQVSTYAGFAGNSGSQNATGTNASFFTPLGVALDASTNLYVADYGNQAIRKITPAQVVTTLAGNPGNPGSADGNGTNAQFYQPEGVAVDSAKNVYVADTANGTIRFITPGGAVSTIAGSAGNYGISNSALALNALFYQPTALTVDSAFNIYVADYLNNAIRKISSSGVVTTLAGSPGSFGSTDGTNALFWGPSGVTVDGSGNLYVADSFNNDLRKVTAAGVVSTFAGSSSIGSYDGNGTAARFNQPFGGAVDGSGNIYVADSVNHTIRKITRLGQVSTFAGSPGMAGSLDGPATNALFFGPQAVAIDAANNLYVADTLNCTIREITPAGVVSTLAGLAGNVNGYDGTGTNAAFNNPAGLTVDSSGNIYVADTYNHTIRKISSGAVVTTLAGLAGNSGSFDGTNSSARFNGPRAIAVDRATNIFVADSLNHTIREASPAGTNWIVSTVAGLAGAYGNVDAANQAARFFAPQGLAVDLADNIYVADTGNQTLREISPSGTNWIVSTVAGLPNTSGSANGAGTNAEFFNPTGLAIDNTGFLYVVDTGNDAVRSDSTISLPLVIESSSVTPRPSSATITWITSQAATSQIQYGLTPAYGITTTLNTNLQFNQGFLLTGLLTNSTYYYELISSNSGSPAVVTGTFSTDLNLILQSSQAQYTGVWVNDSSGPDRYSAVYKFATTSNANTASALFRPAIVYPDQYDVSIWYSEGSNRSSFAPAAITWQGVAANVTVNETLPGGQWITLTTNQPFVAGTNAFVRLNNFTGETNKIVIADAVQWSYSAGQDLVVNGVLPAWYSSFYFGTNSVNSSALAANGRTVLQNYVLGLSPVDPKAALNFNLSVLNAGGFQVTFSPWQSGRAYQLLSATNLAHPVWTVATNVTFTQTNNVGMFAGSNGLAGPAVYYRLSAQLSQ